MDHAELERLEKERKQNKKKRANPILFHSWGTWLLISFAAMYVSLTYDMGFLFIPSIIAQFVTGFFFIRKSLCLTIENNIKKDDPNGAYEDIDLSNQF